MAEAMQDRHLLLLLPPSLHWISLDLPSFGTGLGNGTKTFLIHYRFVLGYVGRLEWRRQQRHLPPHRSFLLSQVRRRLRLRPRRRQWAGSIAGRSP